MADTNKTQRWGAYSTSTPPTTGAFLTERGWEIALEGSAPGQTELLIALNSDFTGVAAATLQKIVHELAPGTYGENDVLSFTAVFNEPVDVDTAGGTPSIDLTIGATSRSATYASGTGSNQLVFTYTIQNGEVDADGIVLTDDIQLNSGTIEEAGTSTNAVITFTSANVQPGTSGILVDAS